MYYLKKIIYTLKNANLLLLISIGVSLYFGLRYINVDLWQDELYSVEHFVFAPLSDSFFNYHKANNHILFNALLNIYCKVLQLSFQNVLYHPWHIRIIPFSLYVLNICVLWKVSNRIFNIQVATFSTAIFVTTLAIVNFSCQLRGYSFSSLLSTIQVLVFLHFFTYTKTISAKNLVLLFCINVLLVLCLPINIYFIGAEIIVCLFFLGLDQTHKPIFVQLNHKQVRKIFTTLLTSAVCISLFYAALYYYYKPEELQYPTNRFSSKNFSQLFASIFHFTHSRFYLYAILLIFFVHIIKFGTASIPFYTSIVCITAIYCIYFIFYWIHGAVVMPRLLVSLVPLFAIMIGLFCNAIIFKVKLLSNYIGLLIGINCLLFIVGAAWNIDKSGKNNFTSKHTQNLVEHYYLNNYNPMNVCRLIRAEQSPKNISVFVLDDYGGTGLSYYLKQLNIRYANLNTEKDLFLSNKKCLIVTNNKLKLTQYLNKQKIGFTALFKNNNYYNVYDCSIP